MGARADQVRGEIEATRADLGETLNSIGDRISPKRAVARRGARMRSGLYAFRDSVMGSASEMEARAGATTAAARARVQGMGDAVAGSPSAARGRALEETRGNPLAAGLIAFGGGMLLGSILKTTSAEQRSAQQLAATAQPALEVARQAASDLAEDLKASAKDAASELKDSAEGAAQRVGDQAKVEAGEVRDAAKGANEPEIP